MDPKRLFAAAPPREPLTTLAAVVRDWQWRYIEGEAKRHRDEVVEYCRIAPDLESAVKRAVDSRRPSGKMHNHQSRIPRAVREEYGIRLSYALLGLEPLPEDFDRLHAICLRTAIYGIGEVTVYDVATRIGAWFGFEPVNLYLHAGCMIGWKLLHPDWDRHDNIVSPDRWPAALRVLPADQVEDLLCCYRAILEELSDDDRICP